MTCDSLAEFGGLWAGFHDVRGLQAQISLPIYAEKPERAAAPSGSHMGSGRDAVMGSAHNIA